MAHLGGEASVEIDAPIDAVWKIVEDVSIAPEWQSGLDEMTVLDRDSEGRAVHCETATDIKVKTVRTRVKFTYEPPTRLSWTQEKGDLKSVVGAWELEDLGGGRTKATYKLDGDPGRVLGMLIRGPVEDTIRKVLVEGRPGELKEISEARS